MFLFLGKVKEVLFLLLASVGYAVGVALFLEPKGLAAGGVSGLAIVLNHLTGINTGFIIFIINVPLIVFGIYKFGLRFFLSTIVVIAVSSAVIDFCERFPSLPLDTLCSSVVGSVLIGGSIGVIFRLGATTGGSDIIVRLLHLKFRHIRTGGIFLFLDVLVICFAGIVFRNIEVCIYAGICVVIEAYVINLILYGMNGGQALCVFSQRADEIEKSVERSGVKVAIVRPCEGAILLLVHKKSVAQLRTLVAQEDGEAIAVASAVGAVYGADFSSLNDDGA